MRDALLEAKAAAALLDTTYNVLPLHSEIYYKSLLLAQEMLGNSITSLACAVKEAENEKPAWLKVADEGVSRATLVVQKPKAKAPELCTWCSDPHHPDPEYHPNGSIHENLDGF